MFAVQPMKNKKAYVYDAELAQFRKDQKKQRESRNQQRASKRTYVEDTEK